ncbi:MAG: hypothetical protein Q9213_008096 [Squamulea squamosa]
MPSRKVVQDSDDEGIANDSPLRQPKGAPDVSSPPANPLAGPSSTGSTELLNREIQIAHTSLLDPSTSSRSSLLSSGPPSISKRRTTNSVEETSTKKPKVTYGARKSQDGLAFISNSDDEASVRPSKRARRTADSELCNNDGCGDESGDHVTTSSSLGVQETVSEGMRLSAPTPRMNDKSRRYQESLTAMPPPEPWASGSTQQDLQSSFVSTVPITGLASSPRVTVSRTRKRAISEIESPKIILGEEIAPSSSAPASSPIKRTSRGEDVALSRSREDADGADDELSLSAVVNSPITSRKQTKAIAKSALIEKHELNKLEMDELLPNPPSENYQPRPSRSRSALAADDLVIPKDFSKRPESLAKKKTKSKLINSAPEAVDQPAGASPKKRQAKAASQADIGSLNEARIDTDVEELLNVKNDLTHDTHTDFEANHVSITKIPSPKPPPPKKSRGRPKKGASVEESVHPALLESVPANKDAGPLTTTITTPAPAPMPAKRGRKNKKPPAEEKSSAIVHKDDMSEDEQKEFIVTSEGVLSDADPNIQPPLESPTTLKEDVPEISKPVSDDSSKPTMSTKTLESPSKSTPAKTEEKKLPGLGKDSPARYRVGLSKRQRIAPLLRVVRK